MTVRRIGMDVRMKSLTLIWLLLWAAQAAGAEHSYSCAAMGTVVDPGYGQVIPAYFYEESECASLCNGRSDCRSYNFFPERKRCDLLTTTMANVGTVTTTAYRDGYNCSRRTPVSGGDAPAGGVAHRPVLNDGAQDREMTRQQTRQAAEETRARDYRQVSNGSTAFYLRSAYSTAGQALYLHTHGGVKAGNRQTLHPCPKQNDHPNCQWMLESSGSGRFYLHNKGNSAALHTHGGTHLGNYQSLHVCPRGRNHGNCQWVLVPSQGHPEAYLLRASDNADLYLAVNGLGVGAGTVLRTCSVTRQDPGCSWIIEPSGSGGER